MKFFDFTKQINPIMSIKIGRNIEQLCFFRDNLMCSTEDGYLVVIN